MENLLENDSGSLRKAMQYAGCDMVQVRGWMETYELIRKRARIDKEEYAKAQKSVRIIQDNAGQLKDIVMDDDIEDPRIMEKIQIALEQMRLQDKIFEHEFLIDRDYEDYHLTFENMISNINELLSGPGFILRSEIENLMAINQEVLGRKTPDFNHLAYYEFRKENCDLSDLPYEEKMIQIQQLYEQEFLGPFRAMMEKVIMFSDDMKKYPVLAKGLRGKKIRAVYLPFDDGEFRLLPVEARVNECIQAFCL